MITCRGIYQYLVYSTDPIPFSLFVDWGDLCFELLPQDLRVSVDQLKKIGSMVQPSVNRGLQQFIKATLKSILQAAPKVPPDIE